MHFGEALRLVRQTKKMSQKELAAKLGIAPTNLCDIEKGRQRISPAKAAEYAKAMGCDPSGLVEAALNDQLDAADIPLTAQVQPKKKRRKS